jgi:peptidoglycan/xylan/chitin deacetylase (PgdA/CDA1 family)
MKRAFAAGAVALASMWAQGAALPAFADDPVPPPPVCTPGANPITGLKTTEKVITFTFDDGPSKTQTPRVMDIFEGRGLTATFFHITNGEAKNAGLVQNMVARGFEIGSHSKSHHYSASQNVKEMASSKLQIQNVTGVAPLFFRMPGLSWGKSVVKATGGNGLCAIDTNAIIGDWRAPRLSAAKLCDRFSKNLKPGQIITLHDGGTSHPQTIKALPCILDFAVAHGYQVLSLRAFLDLATQGRATLTYRRM